MSIQDLKQNHKVPVILILEDEPLLLNYYKKLLQKKYPQYHILESSSIEKALLIIENCIKFKKKIKATVIDLRIRDLVNKRTGSGLTIASTIIKEDLFVDTKHIFITSLVSDYIISNVLDTLIPKGFIIKDEIKNEQYLVSAFKKIMKGETFFSFIVERYVLRKGLGQILLDQVDRKILKLIDDGYRMNDISKKLALSKSLVEKRKSRIVDLLELESNKNNLLLESAKKNMII